jgi:hypothetical protein
MFCCIWYGLLLKPYRQGAWGQPIASHLSAPTEYNYKYSCIQVEGGTSYLHIRPLRSYSSRGSASNVVFCLENYLWTEVRAMLYEPSLLSNSRACNICCSPQNGAWKHQCLRLWPKWNENGKVQWKSIRYEYFPVFHTSFGFIWSRDSSVGIVTRSRAGRPKNRGSISRRGKRFSSP